MTTVNVLIVVLLAAGPARADSPASPDASSDQADTIYATGCGHVGRWWDSGGKVYFRGDDPFMQFYYYAFHSLYQESRVHAYLLFPLDTASRGARPVSAGLCYNQSGVTGVITVGVSLVSDTSISDSTLYHSVLTGLRLADDSSPGPNGFYRRTLNQAAARALDSCRAQGWIVLGLVAGTHNINGHYETIRIDTLNPPFLEVSWASGVAGSSPSSGPVSLRLQPNPAPSRAPIRLRNLPPSGASVTVSDVCGRAVCRLPPGSQPVIAGLAPGVYSIRVAGPGLVLSNKLVVTP
jgi:hypothetical protein